MRPRMTGTAMLTYVTCWRLQSDGVLFASLALCHQLRLVLAGSSLMHRPTQAN